MLERKLIEDGTKFVIIALQVREGHADLYSEFVDEELDDSEAKKIDKAVNRMANVSPPRNPKKGHPVPGCDNLYVLKEYQTRVLWFYTGERTSDGRAVIALTHGFRKKRDKPRPQEIERAERLKAEYLRKFVK